MSEQGPIKRIYALKREAAKQGVGLYRVDGDNPAYRMLAGRDFIADLLMHPQFHSVSMRTLRGHTLSIFGVPIVPANVHPDALRLVFELDG